MPYRLEPAGLETGRGVRGRGGGGGEKKRGEGHYLDHYRKLIK